MSRSVEAQGLAALLNLDAHLEMARISAAAEPSAAAAGVAVALAAAAQPQRKTAEKTAAAADKFAADAAAEEEAATIADPKPPMRAEMAPAALHAHTVAASTEADVETAPALGRIGPYQLKVALAQDGLGQVYKAWDSSQNIDVMLTLLDLESDVRDREVIIAQLQQSVLAASRLQHPGLARIHDAGVVGAGVYIVNLWLPGRTLAQAQWAGWQPTARVAAEMVHELAQALAYAHAHGVLHGGLNPSTVMLDSDDRPTALGLGFACTAHASDLPSMDPLVSGAAPYLAPEQLQGGAVDVRTDVHALGVLLYELLAGHRAYPGETVPEVARALMAHDPAPPHWLRLDVPERLSAIAMQALQRNPAARYAQASEVAAALQAWLQQSEQEIDEARLAFVAAQSVPKPARRRSNWVAAALLVATGLALALAWSGRQDTVAAAGVHSTGAAAAVVTGHVAGDVARDVARDAAQAAAGDGAAAASPLPAGNGDAAAPGPSRDTLAAAPASPMAASVADATVRKPPTAEPQRVTETLLSSVNARLPPTAATVSTVLSAGTPTSPAAPLLAQADAAAGAWPAARPLAQPNPPKPAVRDKARPTADARPPVVPAAVQTGTVQLAVSPWGYVEVGGKLAGASPPLHQLTLPEGSHTITIRNEDFAPFVTTVQVSADKAATVRHRFAQ